MDEEAALLSGEKGAGAGGATSARSDTTDSSINAENVNFTDLTEDERKSFTRTRNTLVCVALAVLVAIAVGVTVAVLVNRPVPNKALGLDEVLDGTLAAQRQYIRWIAQEDDGVSTYSDGLDIYLWAPDFTDADRTLLVDGETVIDPATDEPLDFYDYWIAPDASHVLYATNYVKVWRHSFNATYYVYNVATGALVNVADSADPVQLAVWSPDSGAIAYVTNNNLWILQLPDTRMRITSDGAPAVLNGIPSWVYEEEVFGTNSAVWWSPDGRRLAYMKSDESEVPIYTYPIYGTAQYPQQVQVRYPKAGATNPVTQMVVYSLDTQTEAATLEYNTSYDVDAAWFNTTALLVRRVPRLQSSSTLFLIEVTNVTSPVVSALSTQSRENGWIDYAQLLPINVDGGYYLDIVDVDGYNQLVLFSLADSVNFEQLTGQDSETPYEVLSIAGYNAATRKAYVFTTHQGPSERHLYEVDVFGSPRAPPKRLTPEGEGYYSASFSSGSGYYVLTYDGPLVPQQWLVTVATGTNITLEDNAALATKREEYALPRYRYFNLTINDQVLNAVMLLPERFDESNKGQYPVLLRVYGGPASQLVLKRYSVDWHTYLVSSLGYIVVMLDARGTSGRGNAFKNVVYKNLGFYEALDQLAMGEYLKGLSYVDSSRVYVWGWSYGGYLTSKILEADNRGVFAGGIAVAPVTDWQYYDSIYTERYMLEPKDNAAGYAQSAVASYTNFANKRFLLVHGTEDDNVHYQHSAVLIYKMVAADVPFEMFAYTDNDHSINTGPNTTNDLYSRLTRFLQDE